MAIQPARELSATVEEARRRGEMPSVMRRVKVAGYHPSPTYYSYSMLKSPHWGWEVYLYFFLSGIASAAYVTAAIANIAGRRRYTPVVRAGRLLSLPLLGVCTLLLIKDLGRPDRFLNMMRIYKTRSPMSVGSWALATMSTFSGFAAVYQMASDGWLGGNPFLRRVVRALPIRTIEFLGSFAGFFVAGYTGTLLTATAAPLWGKARALVTPIFIASASSTAMAAMSLILSFAGKVDDETRNRLKWADNLSLLVELGLLALLPRTLGPLARFLTQGRLGALYLAGVIGGIVAPLLMQVRSVSIGRKADCLSGVVSSSLVLAGGFLLRYLFLAAGKASIKDQEAVIEYARGDKDRSVA